MGVKNGIAEAIWRHANGYSWRKPYTVDVPPAALKAATSLVELYEGMNDETVDAMHRRFTKECKKEDTDTYPAHSFGVLLAHVALRTSRQAMIEALFEVPHFQVSLENGELAWEGGADDESTYSEHEVFGRANPKKSEWGFDLTEFNPGGFQKVLDGLGIGAKPSVVALYEDDPQMRGRFKSYIWRGTGIEIVTAHDPIAGSHDPNYAGYMGIRGTSAQVAKAKRLIIANASYIKDDVGMRGLKYIGFEKNPIGNPSGQFTAKGERMYEDVRSEYEAKGDPRAREIAARTVYARAADGVVGLVHRHGKPPGVPNGTRKPASVVTASWGPVHVGDVVEMPADREHGVRGGRATVVALHPGKNWDVTVEARGEEYDLNAGRLLRLIQKA